MSLLICRELLERLFLNLSEDLHTAIEYSIKMDLL